MPGTSVEVFRVLVEIEISRSKSWYFRFAEEGYVTVGKVLTTTPRCQSIDVGSVMKRLAI